MNARCLPTGGTTAATLRGMKMGDRIRRARLDAGYRTLTAFAVALGVSKSLAHQWENPPYKKPGRENLLKIARLTAIDVRYLAGEIDEMNRSITIDNPLLVRIFVRLQRLPPSMQKHFAELLDKTVYIREKI